MNYVKLNGISSNTITGLLIQELPPISKPKMRTLVEEIDGRDGDIVTDLGYSAYDKEIKIGLYGNFNIDNVISFFNSKGNVIFSNEPDKYYNYEIVEQIDFERLVRFRQATVKFHVQPFKYKVNEAQIQVDTTMITAEGTTMDLEYTENGASLAIDLKGNTSQEGTPTPSSPQTVHNVSGDNSVIVCGKNLLKNVQTTQSLNGLTFTINIDKSITIKGTANADTYVYLNGSGNYTETLEIGTYTLSGCTGGSASTYQLQIVRNVNGTLTYTSCRTAPTTFTTTQSETYRSRIAVYNGITVNNVTIYPQLEKSATATSYEPYKSITYPINLPVENLSPQASATTDSSGYINYSTNGVFGYVESGKTYTLSLNIASDNTSTGLMQVRCYTAETSGTNQGNVATFNRLNGGGKIIQTFTSQYTGYIAFNGSGMLSNSEVFTEIQLEKGTKANHYTPYGTTPIELRKIGTYQDYLYKSGSKWYWHREIGSFVLNGTENWGVASNMYYLTSITDYAISNNVPISDMFVGYSNVSNSSTAYAQGDCKIGFINVSGGTTPRFYLRYDAEYNNLTTWLTTHNVTVIYALATATNTEITDATLISQLDALNGAVSYDGQTHILQVNNDNPFWLNVEAFGSVNTTITNQGNYNAKPLLTIYGSGQIGVYLNEIQVFQINLTEETQITLDIANMEAYNQVTKELKNRLVTGDYNNFVLKPSTNKLAFSGNVQGFTMNNYSRWL